jgi:hypothetical protein
MKIGVKEQLQTGLRAIPRGVWVLGLVSMFMDISSEMIHGYSRFFLSRCLVPAPR